MRPLFILFMLAALNSWAQKDVIQTQKGKIKINPVLHGSLVLQWNDYNIFIDPYGGSDAYKPYGDPQLILITDIHGDHLNKETLQGLNTHSADMIVPLAVSEKMSGIASNKLFILNNGEHTVWNTVGVEAIPMYNLPETADSRHPKGRGNGYVLNIAGKRIYISGDTEDIPEMRNLENIDVAFVCMNLPYTMDVNQAADAVLDFAPSIVYPFHFRGGGGKFSDVAQFRRLVESGNKSIEVRVRNWYPKK